MDGIKGMVLPKELAIQPADLWRTTQQISFDIAGEHITAPEDRARIARFLKNHPAS
jgi:hypothetical protein